MTSYVWRNGELVDRRIVGMLDVEERDRRRSAYPSPRVSRFESFESPVVEGKTISSWRQRERDMNAVDAVDRRDIPQSVFDKRAAKVAKMKEVDGG